MPVANVKVPLSDLRNITLRLEDVVNGIVEVEPRVQRFVAELVLIRLFDELQNTIAGIARRLACGAVYANGVSPTLLTVPAKSIQGAQTLFETFNRRESAHRTRWSKVRHINDATRHVIDPNDHFTKELLKYGLEISYMQAIRNRIAHRNEDSTAAYLKVVKRYYGAEIRSIPPGAFLMSSRFEPRLIDRFIAASRMAANGCARG